MRGKKNKKKMSRIMRRAIKKWKEPKPFKATLDSEIKHSKFVEFLGSEVFYPYMASIDRGRPDAEVVITGRTKEGHKKTIVMERKTHSDLINSFRSQAEIYRQLYEAQRYGIVPAKTVMVKVEAFNKAIDEKEEKEVVVKPLVEEDKQRILARGTWFHETAYHNIGNVPISTGTAIDGYGNPIEVSESIRGSNFHYLSMHHCLSPQNKDGVKCSICGDYLHSPRNFPKDFPARFKLCCKCADAWKIENGINSYNSFMPVIALRRHYKYWEKDFKKLFDLEVV